MNTYTDTKIDITDINTDTLIHSWITDTNMNTRIQTRIHGFMNTNTDSNMDTRIQTWIH